MTKQHPLLTTLHEWEQLTDIVPEDSTEKAAQPAKDTGAVLFRVVNAKRGKAQRLPSNVLQPV